MKKASLPCVHIAHEDGTPEPRDFRPHVIRINGGVLLLLTILSFVAHLSSGDGHMRGMVYPVMLMYGVAGQTALNLLAAIVAACTGNKDLAGSLLTSALYTPLIGLGLCIGGMLVTDGDFG